MVNTLALGASAVKRLGVQVSPWAPNPVLSLPKDDIICKYDKSCLKKLNLIFDTLLGGIKFEVAPLLVEDYAKSIRRYLTNSLHYRILRV